MAERKKFLLRLPPSLHEELRAWAEQEMRSLNGQIEYVLREAVLRRRKHEKPAAPGDPDAGGGNADASARKRKPPKT